MTKLLESIFGASWRTTVFGLVQLIVGTALNYYQSLAVTAVFDWKVFGGQVLLALAMFFTKDGKVTGGTIAATPEAVERVDSAK